MRIAPLVTVKAQLSAYLEQCKAEGPIVITRNGKAVAVLLAPIDDDDLEGCSLLGRPDFKPCSTNRERAFRQVKGSPRGSSGTLSPNVMENRQVEKGARGPGGLGGARQPNQVLRADRAKYGVS